MADLANALTNLPIPGQSLTNSPDAKAAYQTPPESTELSEVTKILFKILTQDNILESLAQAASEGEGTSLDNLTAVILHEAFATGKITPDMAILAIEPTLEILMFVCSILDIPVRFSTDDKETDHSGVMKVAKKQAKSIGATSPATLQEWLAQNESKREEPVTVKEVKKAVSLLSPQGVK
jgi:hypothetical protein